MGCRIYKQWIQALIVFPVKVVAAIWVAYTENFVARIVEISGEWGRIDADRLMDWLGNARRRLCESSRAVLSIGHKNLLIKKKYKFLSIQMSIQMSFINTN